MTRSPAYRLQPHRCVGPPQKGDIALFQQAAAGTALVAPASKSAMSLFFRQDRFLSRSETALNWDAAGKPGLGQTVRLPW
jgi:hypothetical protein